MKRALETLKLATEHLTKCHVSNARRVAEELLASVLKCERIGLYMQFDQPLPDGELTLYRELIGRAAKHEPVAYILKEMSFYGCRLKITPAVLIPRQETEILLEKVCESVNGEGKIVWDLCTGSGCLGIGLKKAQPQHVVTLADLSGEALEVALENCRLNGVEVEAVQGDLLAPFVGKRADVIVCNPPYVSEQEYGDLDVSVRAFEPKMALVGGDLGLDFYRRLGDELPKFLNTNGKVFLEMGWTQGEALKEIFSSPFWRRLEVQQDWSGKDRFFFLEAH